MFLAGTVLAAGAAALVWMVLAHHAAHEEIDPLSEADRRIEALEDSLRHLQESFGQTVGR